MPLAKYKVYFLVNWKEKVKQEFFDMISKRDLSIKEGMLHVVALGLIFLAGLLMILTVIFLLIAALIATPILTVTIITVSTLIFYFVRRWSFKLEAEYAAYRMKQLKKNDRRRHEN